jgi:hypothetical protein
LNVDFQASQVTSNVGLILVRELDERRGLEKLQLLILGFCYGRQKTLRSGSIAYWQGQGYIIGRPQGQKWKFPIKS